MQDPKLETGNSAELRQGRRSLIYLVIAMSFPVLVLVSTGSIQSLLVCLGLTTLFTTLAVSLWLVMQRFIYGNASEPARLYGIHLWISRTAAITAGLVSGLTIWMA